MQPFTALKNWRGIATEAIGYAEDLGQLAVLELEAAQMRLIRRLAALVLALLSFVCGLLFVGIAVLIAFWDHPNRIAIAFGIALVYLGIAAILVVSGRSGVRVLDRTRREIEGGLQWLKTHL